MPFGILAIVGMRAFLLRSHSTRMFNNRKYLGEYRFRDIVQPNGIPATITQEVFDQVQVRMERNRRASARYKAENEYLLTTKLFCGKCKKFMIGESGTSQTKNKYFYYKCVSAKKKQCDKKTVKKEPLERYVVSHVKQLIDHDATIDYISDKLVEIQQKESPLLPALRKQLKETKHGIDNIMDAVQQGLFAAATQVRLSELEGRQKELEASIAQEQIKKVILSKDQIVVFLNQFRDGDVDDFNYRRRVIDIFVNAVYLFDDKIIIVCNYKNGTKTFTFTDFESSDLFSDTRPDDLLADCLKKQQSAIFLWKF